MKLRTLVFHVSLLALTTNSAFAISEKNYQSDYSQKISPLIQKMKEGTFEGAEKVKIHYRTLLSPTSQNCLVILPGRTEPIEKYAEVVYDLMQTPAGKNMDFYLMDHRGQGQSGRMASTTDMGHIDRFENYVSDVETFIKLQNLDKRCEHKFLLAHSMGAGIATAYILKHPKTFEKVVLSSPMLKILTKPYAYGTARAIVETMVTAGRGAKFAIGQKGFNSGAKFEDNTFTTSPERFKMAMGMFETYPSTKVGGVSNRWILEIMKGTNPLRSRYHEISTPMVVIHAGNEAYSEPEEMAKLCQEAANCKHVFLPTSKHEVFMDSDANRNIALGAATEFFR
jgi:lysophospholipase